MTEIVDSEKLIQMAQEIQKQIGSELLERIVNVPDMHGDTVGMRVIGKYSIDIIDRFMQISGGLTRIENDLNKVNAAHLILGNLTLKSKEKLMLIQRIIKDNSLISQDNVQGYSPLNYFILSLPLNLSLNDADEGLLNYLAEKSGLEKYSDL